MFSTKRGINDKNNQKIQSNLTLYECGRSIEIGVRTLGVNSMLVNNIAYALYIETKRMLKIRLKLVIFSYCLLSSICISILRVAPMVALETGTGKGISCVRPRGRQLRRGVAVGKSQCGHRRWHWEPDWVVAAKFALETTDYLHCGLQV